MTKNQNKIQETEKRLQFTIVLGMFFPIILEALLNFSGSVPSDTSGTILKSGTIIALLVINYLFFEWSKSSLSSRQLDYLNWVFFTMIICYMCVIWSFSLVTNGDVRSVNLFMQILYPTTLAGIMYVPLVGVTIMIGKVIVNLFKIVSK